MTKLAPLCRLGRKDIKDRLPEIAAVVEKPTHICGRCARVADKKKLLCKPVKLSRAGKD